MTLEKYIVINKRCADKQVTKTRLQIARLVPVLKHLYRNDFFRGDEKKFVQDLLDCKLTDSLLTLLRIDECLRRSNSNAIT